MEIRSMKFIFRQLMWQTYIKIFSEAKLMQMVFNG